MKAGREYADYVRDMLESIAKVSHFIEGFNFERFSADDKTVFAVIRGIELVGEAARNIPATVRSRNANIPWREICGMRDKLIHDYMGINLAVVWKTAKEDLPKLEPQLKQLLAKASE